MSRLAGGAAVALVLFAAAFGIGRATRSSGDDATGLAPAGAPASAPISGLSSVVAVPALRRLHHQAATPVKHTATPSTPAPAPAATPTPRPAVAPSRPAPRPAARPAPAPSKPAPDETIIGGGGGG